MANPRKFSEKIALHNQKQAEETAAFEQIMREVIGATRGAYQKHHHLHIAQSLGSYRGGSLPNVNQIGNNTIDLQSALNSLEDMKQGRECLADRMHRERGRHATPHRGRQFPFEKRTEVSPYSSSSYLSPPPDTNWRRTNSDSALHQSAMNPQENFHGSNTPPSQRRGTVHEMDGALMADHILVKNYWDPKKLQPAQQGLLSSGSRPKSCEVPGINIYPTQEESSVLHVPISNNTGSLPDLTNLHFPSPLATPLDVEDQVGTTPGSPYNQHTPPHTSPSSYSPSGLPSQQQHHTHVLGPTASGGTMIQATAGVPGGGGGGGGGVRHSSPGPSPSPSSQRRHHHNLTNLVIGSGSPRHHGHHPSTHQGLTIDTNALSLDNYPPPPQPTYGVYHQQQQATSPSGHQTFPSGTPTVNQMPLGSYRSTSPADHSCSAPTSPVSHSLSPISSPGLPATSLSKSPFTDTTYYFHQQQQTSALQHQLEQFKMMPEPNTTCSNATAVTTSGDGMFLSSLIGARGCGPPGDLGLGVGGGLNYSDAHAAVLGSDGLDSSALYYGMQSSATDSQLQSPTLYSKSAVISSNHQTTPQTPQTPTSIPDIILTAPCGDEPIMRQDFAKDLGSAMASMSGSFDSDLFAPDDALRAGLDPIDFDGLQILTDPDIPVISDPATEETFRLDRS